MADDDSGSDFDPRFGLWPAPPGTATSFGTPSSGSLGGQPLDDWVKSVTPDELARYTQDPDKQIADWHARGIEVPDAEHIHTANDQFGTPSRPQRLDQGPASPLDQAPIRMNPDGTIAGNITGQQVPLPRPRPAGAPGAGDVVMTDRVPSQKEDVGPGQTVVKKLKESLWPSQTGAGSYHKPGQEVPRAPAPSGETVRPSTPHYPPAGSLNPLDPGFIGPQPPGGPPEPAPTPAVTQPKGTTPPGSQPEVAAEKAQKAARNKGNVDITTEEGRQNVSDAVGTLGKAMQGVKAPEPLRPPQIGAPVGPHPLAANAPQLGALLGLAGGGRPSPPILRLLGRG